LVFVVVDEKNTVWYVGRLWLRQYCVRWGPSSPQKGHSPPPIFDRWLLWPNGWMHHYTTWYAGRPRPRRHCVRSGPSSPP